MSSLRETAWGAAREWGAGHPKNCDFDNYDRTERWAEMHAQGNVVLRAHGQTRFVLTPAEMDMLVAWWMGAVVSTRSYVQESEAAPPALPVEGATDAR